MKSESGIQRGGGRKEYEGGKGEKAEALIFADLSRRYLSMRGCGSTLSVSCIAAWPRAHSLGSHGLCRARDF